METIVINGVELLYKRLSNIEVISYNNNSIPKPKVPKFFIATQNRYIENYDHPLYHTAMELYQVSQSLSVLDALVRKSIRLKYSDDLDKSLIKGYLRKEKNEDPEYLFIKHIVFNDDRYMIDLTNKILHTETRVYNKLNALQVMRNNIPIMDHQVNHTVHTGIDHAPVIVGGHQLVHPLDEYNACIGSGIAWDKWMNQELDLESMAYTVALYRINKLVELHSNDAAQDKAERDSRKKH